MGKNAKLIIIVVVVIALVGIFNFMKGNTGGKGSLGAAGNESNLASCTPGAFSGKSERLTIDITVIGPSAGACSIQAGVSVDQGAGFFNKYDRNNDGNLTMDCTVPSSVTTFAQLTEYLKGPGLQGCSGEYRDLVDSLPSS